VERCTWKKSITYWWRELFGEIGVFSPAHEHTQSARAISDAELLWLTESELAEVCYKNPILAFHFPFAS
jgi:CRP/FNR family cyclic AMP-dependent transcriptional regulator